MMDRICNAVLEKICSLASLGRYVIIYEDEFFENFPDDSDKNEAELKKALRSLVSNGFIDLRYSSGDLYCAAPLKKYEPAPEPIPSPEVRTETVCALKPPEKKIYIFAFLAAFAGGVLGSLVAGIISAAFGC